MKLLQVLRSFAFGESDALAAHRNRIMGQMSVAAGVLLTPVAVSHLLYDRPWMALVVALLVVWVLTDAWRLRTGRGPLVAYQFLVVPVALGVGLSLTAQGIVGALWSYPALILIHFVVSRHAAFVCSLVLIGATVGMTSLNVGNDIAVRVAASQLMTWLMVNIVLNALALEHNKLQQQATTDPLTGALNRRQMDAALGELGKRARGKPVPASILLIDVDNFKQVNDQRGHGAGDQVLIGLVRLLHQRKRAVDSLYRIGGEEFLLLLQDTGAEAAASVAEQLRALVGAADLLPDMPVTISIGVAECQIGYRPEQWLKAADVAMYRAKSGGRNRVENSRFAESTL